MRKNFFPMWQGVRRVQHSFCFRDVSRQRINYPILPTMWKRKLQEGKGTEVKSTEQETDTEQAAVSGETEKQEDPSVEKQSVDCYAYQTLPEEVRTVYDEVYDAILYEKKMWR